MQGIGNEHRRVAVGPQGLRECWLVFEERPPAVEVYVVVWPRRPVIEREGAHTGVDSPARGDRGRGLRVSPGKLQALFCEGVQVRGLGPGTPVGADVVGAQAVYDDQYDVHPAPPVWKVVFREPGHTFRDARTPGPTEHCSARYTRAGNLQKVFASQIAAQRSPLRYPRPPSVALRERTLGTSPRRLILWTMLVFRGHYSKCRRTVVQRQLREPRATK